MSNSSKKKLFKDIYQAIYVANINGLIDENRYIRVLQSISENGFKTYHINNFDRLTVHLKKLNLNKSYTISILLYLRDENYRKIVELSKYFKEIRSMLTSKNKRMVEKIHIISKFLREKLIVAKAFTKTEKIESIYYGKMPNAKMTDDQVKEEWFYHNRQDIIDRLHNLIETFSLDQLKFIGIDLVRSDIIAKTNTVDLQGYYDRTIKRIIATIKSWKRTCLMYVDVDLGYLETCYNINLGRSPELKLKSFEIMIS
jgi:hypothetical protein